jgi:hypothetical protein
VACPPGVRGLGSARPWSSSKVCSAVATLGVETITRLELGGVVSSHNHALTVGSTAELRLESLTGQGAAIFADGFELP